MTTTITITTTKRIHKYLMLALQQIYPLQQLPKKMFIQWIKIKQHHQILFFTIVIIIIIIIIVVIENLSCHPKHKHRHRHRHSHPPRYGPLFSHYTNVENYTVVSNPLSRHWLFLILSFFMPMNVSNKWWRNHLAQILVESHSNPFHPYHPCHPCHPFHHPRCGNRSWHPV